MSNGKRFGLSDSLLDAVKSVVSSDQPLKSHEDEWKDKIVERKEPIEEMSSKEKMKKGLYNSKKMDPVGKADADIDNDGDVDDSDEYLHKRRKAIKKSMAEAAGSRPQDKQAGETAPVKQGASDIHKCAKQVAHEQWGKGETIHGEHGDWDENGNVPWYDVIFEHGIEKNVPTSDLDIITEMHHGHMKKGKK